MLTRRDFLTRVGLGGAALVAVGDPQLAFERLLWSGENPALPTVADANPTALAELTHRVIAALDRELTDWNWPAQARSAVHEGIGQHVFFRSILGVTLRARDFATRDELLDNTDALASTLAQGVMLRDLDTFAELEAPPGVETAIARTRNQRLVLRGIRCYDIATDGVLVRIDLLGGSGEAGQRAGVVYRSRLERVRQQRLATAIRARLGTFAALRLPR